MNDIPEYGYCKHCGRVIAWDDWSFVHLDGWANCRDPLDEGRLGDQHCELLREVPIDPQPASTADAWHVPRLVFVIGEDGTRHPWRQGDPMPALTVHGDAADIPPDSLAVQNEGGKP